MKNINSKDLNLLPVFVALMDSKNLTRAAERLHLSQPALSHALQRLRDLFQDPLFVRHPRGVSPTPKAIKLAPRISELMDGIEQLLQDEPEFNPQSAQGKLKLWSTEYFEHLSLPKLIPQLAVEAPKLVLHSKSGMDRFPKEALESGECDVAVAGFFGDLPDGFYSQKLFEDDFVCIVSQKHPRIKDKMTLDEYLLEKHIIISMQGDMKAQIDTLLEKKKKKRQLVAGISNFLTPSWVVAESELILTAPRKLCESFVKNFKLRILECPIILPPINVIQVWHERTHRSPLHMWFRKQLGFCSLDKF